MRRAAAGGQLSTAGSHTGQGQPAAQTVASIGDKFLARGKFDANSLRPQAAAGDSAKKPKTPARVAGSKTPNWPARVRGRLVE